MTPIVASVVVGVAVLLGAAVYVFACKRKDMQQLPTSSMDSASNAIFRPSDATQPTQPAGGGGGGGGGGGAVLSLCLQLATEIVAAANTVVVNHARCHLLAERIQVGRQAQGQWGPGGASGLLRALVLLACTQLPVGGVLSVINRSATSHK